MIYAHVKSFTIEKNRSVDKSPVTAGNQSLTFAAFFIA